MSPVTRLSRFPLLFGLVFSTACKGDKCKDEPASLQLDVEVNGGQPGQIRSLQVAIVSAEIQRKKNYDLSGELDDGQTSIAVVLDPPPTSDSSLQITVTLFDQPGASGAILGSSTNDQTVTPDGCNRFTIVVDVGGPPVDGGIPDVPDLGFPDGGPDAGIDTGVDTGIDDTGVDDTGIVDTGVDAGLPLDSGVSFPYSPSNFDQSLLPTPGFGILNCGVTTFNTTDLSFGNWCGGTDPAVVVQSQAGAGGPEVVVVSLDELIVQGTLQVTGDRPVIFAVDGDVQIQGTVEVGAQGNTSGPGGSIPAQCQLGTGEAGGFQAGGGGAGGGGGFGAAGTSGGTNANGAGGGAAGAADGSPALVPLRGGCRGGNGAGGTIGVGGAGGGAVQISAVNTINLTGVIRAGGGGGQGGGSRSGAGGAGSGGGVLLEGVQLTLVGSSIFANGGGGGAGGSDGGGRAASGEDSSEAVAQGGLGALGGGNGGDGATGVSAPTNGEDGNNGRDGGGGGGGGLGRIRLNAMTGCTITGTTSPAATSNGAPGCP